MRQPSPRVDPRVRRQRDEAREGAGVVADVFGDHLEPVVGAASLLAIASCVGIADSDTSRAASAVVAAGMQLHVPAREQLAALVERGRVRAHDARRPRATAPARPSRQCGSAASPPRTIESGEP